MIFFFVFFFAPSAHIVLLQDERKFTLNIHGPTSPADRETLESSTTFDDSKKVTIFVNVLLPT